MRQMKIPDNRLYLLPWEGRSGSMHRFYFFGCGTYIARVLSEDDWYFYHVKNTEKIKKLGVKTPQELMDAIDKELVELGYMLLTPERVKTMELLL